MVPAPTAVPGGGTNLGHVEPDTRRPPADHQPPPRQCGRCRLLFEGDPTLHPPAQPDWWLCLPCRATLFGRNPRSHHVAHRREVGDTP